MNHAIGAMMEKQQSEQEAYIINPATHSSKSPMIEKTYSYNGTLGIGGYEIEGENPQTLNEIGSDIERKKGRSN